MSEQRQITCPGCGAEVTEGAASCVRCGADLSLLCSLAGIADAWFGKSLKAAAAGEWGRALEWASACCAAAPSDAEARKVRAKLWARLGLFAEARRCLDEARAVAGEDCGLDAVAAAIRETEEAAVAGEPSEPKAEKRGAKTASRRRRGKAPS